jgi:hypothetical protein
VLQRCHLVQDATERPDLQRDEAKALISRGKLALAQTKAGWAKQDGGRGEGGKALASLLLL